MSTIDFITLERLVPRCEPDTSTLTLRHRVPQYVDITGVLPHGTRIRPASAHDRDALVSWLQSLEYADD